MGANGTRIDPIWADLSKRVMAEQERKQLEEPKPLTLTQMYKRGISYQTAQAIKEAHDGEKAREAKRDRLGRLVGIAYLLLTESIQLIDEAELMMDRQFRMTGGFSHAIKGINRHFDQFYRTIIPWINAKEMHQFHDDLEALDTNVRSFARLEGYKQATDEDRIKSIHDRIINLHKDFLDKLVEYKELAGDKALKDMIAELKQLDNKP